MKQGATLLFILLALVISTASRATEQAKPAAWPMRYVIFVETESWYQARLNNWRKEPVKYTRLQGFIPATFAKAQGAKERLAIMTVDFDQQGMVTTKTLNGVPLQGLFDKGFFKLVTPPENIPQWRISMDARWREYSFELLNGDQPWEEGRMTFCGHRETDRLNADLINTVDGPTIEYKLEPEEGLFYCNDWSKQLANPDRPWIDVTSYEKRGPRVRKFQGYGLFGVIKPVVGKHHKTWICFADCPDAKPGVIADIKAWSKQYKLPVEERDYGM